MNLYRPTTFNFYATDKADVETDGQSAMRNTVSKNDTDVTHHNFDADLPILITFGRDAIKGDLLSHLS